MRAIRFVMLLIVLAVALLATPTFDLRPFATLLPTDFMADSTRLLQFRQWVMNDLARASLLLTSCAALTFGLLTAPWPFDEAAAATIAAPQAADNRRGRRRWWGGALLFLMAVAASGSLLFWPSPLPVPIVHLLWVTSSLFLLGAAALWTVHPTAIRADHRPWPRVGWRTLVLILFLSLLFYSWKLTTLPAVVDDAVAQMGLRSLALARGEQTSFFAVEPTLSAPDNQLFTVALAPTALLIWITGDLLLSTRLLGLVAALLCAGATWLVALELFARRPTPPNAPLPLEDDGRSLALIATLLVLCNVAVLAFSRRPILLEATAWGTLGCWALLRGMRTADRLAIGLSGVLVGLSYLFHGGALVFILTALLWWLGFGAVQHGLLPHRARSPRTGPPSALFLLWLLGFLVITAPMLGVRGQEVLHWFGQIPPSPASALTTLLASVAPPVAIYPAPLYNLVLLPLFPLTLGLLLFNLDRRQGWLIVTWLSSALLVAAYLQPPYLRWEMLLPLVPALALALAFTLDRLRVTLIQAGGDWVQQFLTYALLGLLLWIGFQNVTTYYAFVLRQHDPISTLGYALRALPATQPVLVQLAPAGAPLTAEAASTLLPLRFLTNDTLDAATSQIQFVAELPAALAPGTVVLLPPDDHAALAALRSRYPTGTAVVHRDIQANPLLTLYTVPPAVP